MESLIEILSASWVILVEMSPWLLLGFALSGVLDALLPEKFIRKHLEGKSMLNIVKAVFIGIPLPLCSCGVIPVATMLRNAGASKGSVAAFTASTPQTGVDSISATYSLMGLPFTLGRIAADVIAGLFAGFVINLYDNGFSSEVKKYDSCCASAECGGQGEKGEKSGGRFANILKKGFFEIPRDIGGYVIVGILLGATLSVLIPENLIEQYLGSSLLVMYALVTILSVPVYVCATGSIPIAYGLMLAGISPGAAIVFLVTGPATNTATVSTLFKLIGRTPTLIYILALVAGSWTVGYVFDVLAYAPEVVLSHEMKAENSFGIMSAVIVVALFVISKTLRLP